jgi:hypothetical protein
VRYRRRRESLSANPIGMCKHIVMVLDKAEQRGKLTASQLAALRQQRAHFQALLSLYEGKKAFFDRDVEKAVSRIAAANRFFKSRKLSLVLWLMRAAPHLLLRAYNLRDRVVVGMSTRF